MNKKKNVPAGKRVLELVRNNAVPIMFVIICAAFIPMAGFSPSYLLNEIVTRMGRNLFLVLCLLFPIMAGMGLNFAMTLGAMGAEIAIILVADWQIWGIPGVVLAMILSIPFSALLVGGASVEKASIGNAFLGVILFHLMFIVAPRAGGFITGDTMVGEYFRVFLSYGVITVALIMYEAKKRMAKSRAGRELAEAQSQLEKENVR